MSGLRISQIQDGLFDWADTVSAGDIPSEQIVFREQSVPLPSRPCIAIKITNGPQRVGSYDDVIPSRDAQGNIIDGEYLVAGQRVMSVNIQVYDTSVARESVAQQVALTLHSSLTAPNSLEILSAKDIAIHRIDDILNISDIEESSYEDRFSFDILIGVAENFKQKIENIETVGEIEADIKSC